MFFLSQSNLVLYSFNCYQICNMNNKTGGAETADPSGGTELLLINLFSSVQCFVDHCLSFRYFFSFGYCIVCPFLDLRLVLPLWYLHTLIENQLFCILNIISYMPKLNPCILVNMTMSLDDYVKLIINLHVFEDFVLSLKRHILSNYLLLSLKREFTGPLFVLFMFILSFPRKCEKKFTLKGIRFLLFIHVWPLISFNPGSKSRTYISICFCRIHSCVLQFVVGVVHVVVIWWYFLPLFFYFRYE